ncbi:MAG: peptidoglycan editing factor PgeF [Gammaproteobacteria bacterium]|nr:peptidoglycan editing factor PgeF [Gammaproteobacteria bacterium]MCP4088632.1 peptidoglycan editing factor PgeF [Gammaproteobacteria bacterium]MCP4276460.1 peptidoglycan editing factor PgeF [Gammaproteobacteria bacterium]MCP4832337.1 peptidoglycan editing factor PgeF [Gammaproteobacteria bacterium]MCP4929149.1 peptidoglycan editing factor PgeF [Gammaproteobacteria bacterium]
MALSNQSASKFIYPDWPAPDNVCAVATTRYGGVSEGGFTSLNLADHVGDDPKAVASNRNLLIESAGLPAQPAWLMQVHGTTLVQADATAGCVEADAAWTATANIPCVILTADCLPVLLCDRGGTQVAAVHAGWRGLCAGVLDKAVEQFLVAGISSKDILAWLGPAIGPDAYEVDASVRNLFMARLPDCASSFSAVDAGHWHFNLYTAAREILASLGVSQSFGGAFCTYSEDRFYSYRHQADCGRQASLVWLGV